MVGAGIGSLMFITTLLGAAEPLGARLVKPVVGAFVALEMVAMLGMVGMVGMVRCCSIRQRRRSLCIFFICWRQNLVQRGISPHRQVPHCDRKQDGEGQKYCIIISNQPIVSYPTTSWPPT